MAPTTEPEPVNMFSNFRREVATARALLRESNDIEGSEEYRARLIAGAAVHAKLAESFAILASDRYSKDRTL